MSCARAMIGSEFSREELAATAARRGLLSMELEPTARCNFKCRYCYAACNTSTPEMPLAELQDLVLQARDLGARKIILLGGEPMLYTQLRELVQFITAVGLQVELFTNGTRLDAEAARFLLAHRVLVVLKMNSRNPAVQNDLAGQPQAAEIIQAAFTHLLAAGYPAGGLLGVSSILCPQNQAEIPDMWVWLRDQGIIPYFEMVTPQGNAVAHPDLELEPQAAKQLFHDVARIDREHYGNHWEPQPPLLGSRCLRHSYSCLVTTQGEVMPCVGVTIPLGNVRQARLVEILHASDVLADLRNHEQTIQGACGTCAKAQECYGCRGAAYQLTGNYLASDALCWELSPAPDADGGVAGRLPHAVADWMLPHAPPMRMIDTILEVAEGRGRAGCTVAADNPFLSPDGLADATMFLELMAQACAALVGFRRIRVGISEGMLVGVRGFHATGRVGVGAVLEVTVNRVCQLGEFGVLETAVWQHGVRLAQAELKVWQRVAVACNIQ